MSRMSFSSRLCFLSVPFPLFFSFLCVFFVPGPPTRSLRIGRRSSQFNCPDFFGGQDNEGDQKVGIWCGVDEAPEPGAPRLDSFFVWPRLSPGLVTITRWTRGWTPSHELPSVTRISVRCPRFPGRRWPSTRFAWPSPCSLSLHTGFSLECGRSGVLRGWSSSLPECQSSRPGFASLGET